MGDYGFKISNTGEDINATDPRKYTFWSKYNTVKIYKQGSGTVTIASGSYENDVDIAHGLSFVPMYLVYSQLKDGSGNWFINRTKAEITEAGDQYVKGGYTSGPTELGLWTDSTNLHITYKTWDNSTSHDIDYYYFIFGDKGED